MVKKGVMSFEIAKQLLLQHLPVELRIRQIV